jgi:hypothetical protein
MVITHVKGKIEKRYKNDLTSTKGRNGAFIGG